MTGGPLTVEGVARGFEATVRVTAFRAGNAGAQLDQEVTQAGALETLEPYSVSLDLSDAAPGDTVVLLVRGDTGLETDPGDFGAIPVVVLPDRLHRLSAAESPRFLGAIRGRRPAERQR